MNELRYGFQKRFEETTFEQAVEKVTTALDDEGFGVLTEIDVNAAVAPIAEEARQRLRLVIDAVSREETR